MSLAHYEIELRSSFEHAVQLLKSALAREGFGVLTEVDVRRVLAEKLGVAFPAYSILGACNPELAYRALQAEPLAGLALPCNIVVRSSGPESVAIEIASPMERFEGRGDPVLTDVAREAGARIRRVLAALEQMPLVARVGTDPVC